MKKLNNKGFAISTMLYGMLTLVVIILMLLLNIMQSSYNKENAATDEIYFYLNKCVSKQIALEKCYKTYDDDPANIKSCADEYEAYTTCTGKRDDTSTDKKYLNTTLINKASDKNSGIALDIKNNNRYVFRGANPNNYININELTGRIIGIEATGQIKVLLLNPKTEAFDTENSTSTDVNGVRRWENSTLYNTFNNKFNSFEDKNIFSRGTFHFAVIYNVDSTFEALEKIDSSTDATEMYYGLPSLSDYFKASGNTIEGSTTYCDLNETTSGSIADAFKNCKGNNWMNVATCSWTSTPYGGIDEYTSYSATEVINKSVTSVCNGYMVIYLNQNTTITTTGDGSISNPYIVE